MLLICLKVTLNSVLSGGSYSIYYALAVASKELDADHR